MSNLKLLPDIFGRIHGKNVFFIFEYIEEKITRGKIFQLRNKLEY